MTPQLLTIEEFCEITRIGRTRTYQLLNQGKIKALKLGKKTLIPQIAIEEFIASLAPYNSTKAS